MDLPTLYAIGAFIQSLGQNPEIESELRSLGSQTHILPGHLGGESGHHLRCQRETLRSATALGPVLV
jgi:hypothetical protein